jgi:hypothetical protein
MFGVTGVANVVDDAGVSSALQQVIPCRLTGPLGVRRALLLLSMGLGSAVAPLLIRALGVRGTLIAAGLLLVAVAEHLASVLQSASYEPGDVIIREKEPGDRFYLIAGGQARATKGDEQLSQIGPGDSFGEIALLRRIPRTATVTALTRLEVRILAREEFLAAVTGSPESTQSAAEVVSTRLEAGPPGHTEKTAMPQTLRC